MRCNPWISAVILLLATSHAHADSTNDQAFANGALRELHNLAAASAHFEQAGKDDDRLGCQEAYESIQRSAHDALTEMHGMSFPPIDALKSVSTLLRVSSLTGGGCPDEITADSHSLLILSGQAIIALRSDYSIGDKDWFTVNDSGEVETKGPLRYAQSLNDQYYDWVDARPKDMMAILVPNWKAEMASIDVADPSIENSGTNLTQVEVDYRKKSDDANTSVYFYRSREEAQAASQEAAQQAADDAKAAAEQVATDDLWRQKFSSLPYVLAIHDIGYKLIYGVCKPAPKGAGYAEDCKVDLDWTDSRAVPYRWFTNLQGCGDAQDALRASRSKSESTADVQTACVPAPKATARTLKGYKIIFSLTPPDGDTSTDNIFADFRDPSSSVARIFKNFDTCDSATNDVSAKTLKDLGAGGDGTLLSDDTKVLGLIAECVRVY